MLLHMQHKRTLALRVHVDALWGHGRQSLVTISNDRCQSRATIARTYVQRAADTHEAAESSIFFPLPHFQFNLTIRTNGSRRRFGNFNQRQSCTNVLSPVLQL